MPIPKTDVLNGLCEIVLTELGDNGGRKSLATFRKRPIPPQVNLPMHQRGRLFRRIEPSELTGWRGAIRAAWGTDSVNET
jgi:hypothetical protein